MINQKSWKNSIYFGIAINLMFFLIIYIVTALYLWRILDNIYLLMLSYIMIIVVLKFFITKIYSILVTEPKMNVFMNKIYGINNRSNWGGVFKELVPPDQDYLEVAIKQGIQSLKNKPKTTENIEKMNELEQQHKKIKTDVITGGTIFELFFCLRTLL